MTPVYTVGVRAYVEGATDAHGNPIDSWAAPVDIDVYAVAPRTSSEPDPARSEVVVGLQVMAPPGTTVDHRSRVVVDGVEYEVEGDVADWTRGPFGFAPGVLINLKRTGG